MCCLLYSHVCVEICSVSFLVVIMWQFSGSCSLAAQALCCVTGEFSGVGVAWLTLGRMPITIRMSDICTVVFLNSQRYHCRFHPLVRDLPLRFPDSAVVRYHDAVVLTHPSLSNVIMSLLLFVSIPSLFLFYFFP